jgi:hypothetical protein
MSTGRTGKQKTFANKPDGWGFRAQMAGELFGDPATARSTPVRLVSNISGSKQHGYYVLSETMVRYLDQPTETGTDLFRAYQDACALALRSRAVQERAREEERFAAIGQVAKPFGSALYLDFLRLIWRFAPETGRSSEQMITALGKRYGLRRRAVYNYIEQAEQHFVRTLRSWHQEQTKNALLANVARTQQRHAREQERANSAASPHVPAGVALDRIATELAADENASARERARATREARALLRAAQDADAAAREDTLPGDVESDAEITGEQGISIVELAEELGTSWGDVPLSLGLLPA